MKSLILILLGMISNLYSLPHSSTAILHVVLIAGKDDEGFEKACKKDIANMLQFVEYIREQQNLTFKVTPNIIILDSDITQALIKQTLEDLNKHMNEEDKLLLYYTGHGGYKNPSTKYPEKPYGRYIEPEKKEEIFWSSLDASISGLKCGLKFLLIDACGIVTSQPQSPSSIVNFIPPVSDLTGKRINEIFEGRDYFRFFASECNRYAYTDPNEGSIFTLSFSRAFFDLIQRKDSISRIQFIEEAKKTKEIIENIERLKNEVQIPSENLCLEEKN